MSLAGCLSATYPNQTECEVKKWFLGHGARDPCAPYGPYPVSGQQVYIQDQYNFCIGLPDPASPVLQNEYYKRGHLPTIVQGEGNMQVYCVGEYLPP
ncbi:hypothetical protein HDU91_000198, partial [Kappamyces sp. JEL0680]